MPERTRWIISQRMAGVKMDEIGAELGISESRVSQILFEIRPELERVLVGQYTRRAALPRSAPLPLTRSRAAAADGSVTRSEIFDVGSRLSSLLSSVR